MSGENEVVGSHSNLLILCACGQELPVRTEAHVPDVQVFILWRSLKQVT